MWGTFLSILTAWMLTLCVGDALQVNLVSDTHYDPAYGQSNGYGKCVGPSPVLGQEGCDAPRALITSLCEDMSAQGSAYTLVMGDLQRHRFRFSELTLNDTIGFITKSLASVATQGGEAAGPRVGIALGNNDMVPNYYFNISGDGNGFIESEGEIMQQNGVLLPDEAKRFKHCGYYLRTVSPQLRVIVLHTLIWCYSVSPPVPDTEADPCGQFEFLTTELEAAEKANSKVIIIGHIPPFINIWGVFSAHGFRSVEEDMYWKPMYQIRYNELMEKYRETVIVQFYGHTHLFSFQALEGGVPCFIVPSVTPLYGNNASYMIADLEDGDWSVKSLKLRYLNNSSWSDSLHVENVFGHLSNISSLRSEALNLTKNGTLWGQYLTLRAGGSENHALFPDGVHDSWHRRAIACSMVSASWDNITLCVEKGNDLARREVVPIVLFVLLLALPLL